MSDVGKRIIFFLHKSESSARSPRYKFYRAWRRDDAVEPLVGDFFDIEIFIRFVFFQVVDGITLFWSAGEKVT